MRVLAPAKINLHLRVGPVRADGFHPLLTWMCTVALFDTLDIRRAGGDGTTLTIEQTTDVPTDGPADASAAGITVGEAATGRSRSGSGDGRGKSVTVPADGTNLVARAASLWVMARHGTDDVGPAAGRGLSINLRKAIPVGAGLGGGSSDAARTLMALDRLDDARLSPADLSALGAKLGSDVPFFFHGPSSVCTGRGEIVTPIAPPRLAKWAVLFLPGVALSTPLVYRRFDAMKLGRATDVEVEPDWSAWAALPAGELMSRLVNDLEAPAFDVCPELGASRATLERAVGQVVRMSGSGSSLFTIFDRQADAIEASDRVRKVWSEGRIEVVELCPKI